MTDFTVHYNRRAKYCILTSLLMFFSLSVEVNIRCGTFFFGNDCTRKCRSDKSSFDCTSTGDRVCRPGE